MQASRFSPTYELSRFAPVARHGRHRHRRLARRLPLPPQARRRLLGLPPEQRPLGRMGLPRPCLCAGRTSILPGGAEYAGGSEERVGGRSPDLVGLDRYDVLGTIFCDALRIEFFCRNRHRVWILMLWTWNGDVDVNLDLTVGIGHSSPPWRLGNRLTSRDGLYVQLFFAGRTYSQVNSYSRRRT